MKITVGKSQKRRVMASREPYKMIRTKSIRDAEGWLTDYTLYEDVANGTYFCMFGDSDVYGPDPDYADWEGDTYEEAMEWFDGYTDLDEDDIYGAVEEEPYEEYTGEHDEYEDVWDSIKEIDQEFTSENTSTNSTKRPALFEHVSLEPGTVNVDYGGGRYDNVAEYLVQFDIINMVLDPFNRSKKHNREVINLIREHGGADTATCANVLNVIKEPENRYTALENLKKLVKPGGKIYIWIYEGNKSGVDEPTTRGYQLNRKSADYMEEIQQVFSNVKRSGQLYTIVNDGSSGSVAASTLSNDDLIFI